MKKNKKILLSLLAILTLMIMTGGISYAFFTYLKEGTTENTIKTGIITFLYTEVEANGKGIAIQDAFPISDDIGKTQTGTGHVFDFIVQAKNTGKASIPYEITARKASNSTLDEKAVRIYLTELTGSDQEQQQLLDTYSNLSQTSIPVSDGVIEKKIYTDTVPANSNQYEKKFRLRMWIVENLDFSPIKDENNQDIYPYNDKTFSITVNAYANAQIVTIPLTDHE